MKSTTKIALTITIFLSSNSFAQQQQQQQQQQLYFIKATSVYDCYSSDYDEIPDEIPAAIYSYNKDSMKLDEVVKLTTNTKRLQDIIFDYESMSFSLANSGKIRCFKIQFLCLTCKGI